MQGDVVTGKVVEYWRTAKGKRKGVKIVSPLGRQSLHYTEIDKATRQDKSHVRESPPPETRIRPERKPSEAALIGENQKTLLRRIFELGEDFSPEAVAMITDAAALMNELYGMRERDDGTLALNHALRAAVRIMRFFEQREDPDLIVAAMLHDALEDHLDELVGYAQGKPVSTGLSERQKREIAATYLRSRFGREVSMRVSALSNPERTEEMTPQENNARYLEHVKKLILSPKNFYIKLSDLLDNSFTLKIKPKSREDMHKQRQKLRQRAEKYLPLYILFRERLDDPDIAIPEHKKQIITSILQTKQKFAERILGIPA
ncbi:MAG: HD domain-containing protein [Patescibacteria group bacterium]|nr:HD domain-containing protein [Patescibacteria group bacterium]